MYLNVSPRGRFPRLYAAASLKQAVQDAGARALERFPRLYAAASLKLYRQTARLTAPLGFPRLYAAASLKPSVSKRLRLRYGVRFPRLYAAASLKLALQERLVVAGGRFPRLYAAASLKPVGACDVCARGELFSAALCRGLIEAREGVDARGYRSAVFRGFMPRPH